MLVWNWITISPTLASFWASKSYTTTNWSVFEPLQEDATLKANSKDPLYRIACDKSKESCNSYNELLLGGGGTPLYILHTPAIMTY